VTREPVPSAHDPADLDAGLEQRRGRNGKRRDPREAEAPWHRTGSQVGCVVDDLDESSMPKATSIAILHASVTRPLPVAASSSQ